MITKPAILECTRCGKIFIGWEMDPPRPKGWPTCLKCQTHRAWDGLAEAIEPKKRRGAGGKPKSAKRSVARAVAGKRSVAKARKRRAARAQR